MWRKASAQGSGDLRDIMGGDQATTGHCLYDTQATSRQREEKEKKEFSPESKAVAQGHESDTGNAGVKRKQ